MFDARMMGSVPVGVTLEGKVKVLGFGLAKADEPPPGFAQKVAELTPCRRAARRAALPLCEGENKAAHFVGSFSPSQRGRRERSERGGRFGDFLCKAPPQIERP